MLREAFEREYARLYGKGALVLLQDVELFGLRARLGKPLDATVRAQAAPRPAPAPRDARRVFWPTCMDWIETPVRDGTALRAADRLDGPAIIELPHTSVALAPGQALEVDSLGNYVVTGQ
jgi:N-methylhydantoinase A